ncbi:glycosyltransferase family 9 protein [Opitutus sp. ER46]|uniref:LpxL/LpxP family acyltransferase n=1 Tax=Opitutus sp. ER46 TaxID=2161864 RepID=UPI00130486FD|nr:glycosyltransferase family 9 protein [Opitutus sp. ER46]
MLLLILKVLGWLIARAPEFLLRATAVVLGDVIFFALRHRLILSNLHHAFPEKPATWHTRIGRESCRRMVETGLLSLATPFISEARMRHILLASPTLETAMRARLANPAGIVFAAPHIAYWETETALALLIPPECFPEFGIIYRPLDNAAADAFVKRSREQYGMRLLSRREGFAEALKILRRQGAVGVLFDQNAGMQGALTLLFDRVCSTSELSGLMTEKFNARLYGIFPRRVGFWQIQICVDPIPHAGTSAAVTLATNRWLEQLLRGDENVCASWLWAHARWRNQDIPTRRLRLEAKRNLLADDLAARGLTQPPRRTRIWIRLPNWLGDVVMALPLLRALRASRPDAEITLVARAQFLPLLQTWGVADRLHAVPPEGGLRYWRHFWQLRREYIDVWILFTNSFRGDLEAKLSGTRQRFGILRSGKRRPFLSHAYRVPPDFDESRRHQLELWEDFLGHFGLAVPADRTPLAAAATTSVAPRGPIGLLPGSENNPEKRWPVAHWRAVIEALPQENFVIFGTPKDAPIAEAVAAGFAPDRVRNRAGKTDLTTFAAGLAGCRLLITNDSGGMHLANALGVPLLGLFGPTNPVRTGPVFAGQACILQPPGCPATGGGRLADLAPARVLEALAQATPAPSSQ